MATQISRLTRCHQWTKHWPSAVLLYRIFYWHPRTKIEKNGLMWIARSRADWAVEVDLTENEVKNAVERLKSLGIILTRQGIWRNKNILHVSLVDSYYVRLCQASPNDKPSPGKQEPEEGPGEPLEGVLGDATPITGSLDKEIIQDQILTDQINASADAPEVQITISGEQEVQMVKKFGSVAEVLANAKALTPKPAKESDAPLDMAWKTLVAKHTEKFVPELTIAHRAQLKAFGKRCPPGTAHAVLGRVLADWPGFALAVKAEAGLSQVPLSPQIGFLLKHVGIAVNFKSGQKPEQSSFTPVAKTVKVQPTAPKKIGGGKASLAEVLDIFGEDPKKE